MSDFAEGWIVLGAARAALLAALKADRRAAFLTRRSRPIVVFPRTARDVTRFSARLPKSTIVTFSAGDDWGEVGLVRGGERVARLKTSGKLTTRAHLELANELVEKGLEIGSPVPAAIILALGVDYERVRYRAFDTLSERRLEAAASDEAELVYVDAEGREEPFTIVAQPAPTVRDAKRIDVDRGASPREILASLRRLDPKRASPAARASLEELALLGPSKASSDDQRATVREAAASLLARSLESLPSKSRAREATRLAGELAAARDGATRAVLAQALRRVGALVRPVLERVLDDECDPAAARREYEALSDIRHDIADGELITRTRSKDVRERKGAYALLEQSASAQTLPHLEVCLRSERDKHARVILAIVVEHLRADGS
jgi:hypothetical protein